MPVVDQLYRDVPWPALAAALDLARQGVAVFPLVGKAPACHNGFHDATSDPDEIEELFAQHPKADGVGIQPGRSGLLVIDLDEYKPLEKVPGLVRFREEAERRGGLPETLTVRTGGGGRHLYFRCPDREITQMNGIRNPATGRKEDGVDVRCWLGYLVAPPSVHPDTGRPYGWIGGSFDRSLVAELPGWLLELVDPPEPERAPRPVEPLPDPSNRSEALFRGRVLAVADKIRAAGSRTTARNEAYALGGCVHWFPQGLEWARGTLHAAVEDNPPKRGARDAQKAIDAALDAGQAEPLPLPPDRDDYQAPRAPRTEAPAEPPPDLPPFAPVGMYDEDPNPHSVDSVDSVNGGWGAIDAFDTPTDLPGFPVDALPRRAGEYVDALATATQTPPDMAAMVLLGVGATAVQAKYRIRGWDGWYEDLSLWPLVALPPGNRKSAVIKAMLDPVYDHERKEREAAAPRLTEALEQRKALQSALDKARKQAVKASATDEERKEVARLVAELENTPEPFELPILVAMDATPEAVASLLEQQGRITLASAEGAEILAIAGGRYGEGGRANYDILLKAHAGDAHTVHRMSRASLHIPRAIASLVLAVQPDVLQELDPGMRGRGLLGRFLYCLPPSPLGGRRVMPPPVPEDLTDWYRSRVASLLSLAGTRQGTGAWDSKLIDLSIPARSALLEWAREVEPRLGPGGDLEDLPDWAGKLVGATLRIAGVLHALDCPPGSDPSSHPVDVEQVTRAVTIARYLEAHARGAFDLMGGGTDGSRKVRKVLDWIRRKERHLFTERDAWQDLRRSFGGMDDLRSALGELARRNYLQKAPEEPRNKQGRKPSPQWVVNPAAHA